jgi:acyl carrier protein
MTLADFYSEVADAASLPPGSLTGEEKLDSLKNWDSLAIIEFMLKVDVKLGIQLDAAQFATCKRVSDLAILCGFEL